MSSSPAPAPSFIVKLARFVIASAVELSLVFGLAQALEIPKPVPYIAFGLNWVVGFFAVIFDTEKYYDLTGAMTYILATAYSFYKTQGPHSTRQLVNTALVLVWCIRLGTFLYSRIHRVGKDVRFDTIKPNTLRFFNAWTLQAVWVFITAMPVYFLNTNAKTETGVSVLDMLGWALWIMGFVTEVTADSQKTMFSLDPRNKGQFIKTGLWSWSRHPNYVGEITLWIGMCISCSNAFTSKIHYLCLLSPLFVFSLIRFLSGVPMLEASADKKWGEEAEYKAYKAKTPLLFPFFK